MKLIFFLYCALGPLLKKAQGLLAWRVPVTQAATWAWAAKSARARHPPGPRFGPTARPPASVRFHPTAERRFRRNKIAGGRRFSSQTLGHFALSFPVLAGGSGAPPSLLGPAVGAMAVRSPRSVRSLFSSPYLSFATTARSRGTVCGWRRGEWLRRREALRRRARSPEGEHAAVERPWGGGLSPSTRAHEERRLGSFPRDGGMSAGENSASGSFPHGHGRRWCRRREPGRSTPPPLSTRVRVVSTSIGIESNPSFPFFLFFRFEIGFSFL